MRYGMLFDVTRCVGCAACVMACKVEHATLQGTYWSSVFFQETGTYPNARMTAIPAGCMHCQNAPCVQSCPTGASHHSEEGVSLVDHDKCIGCRTCVNACPYNARHYNYTNIDDNRYFGQDFAPTPFELEKTGKHIRGTVEKCVMCDERVAEGKNPACVTTCIARARIFGDLDDPESEISAAIKAKNARPMAEHLSTQPNVYYAGKF